MRSRTAVAVYLVMLVLASRQLAIAREQTQKALQTFNVKSYGAAADGKHDDTKAIQAAIAAASAAGGEVFMPAGKYFLTSSLAITGAAHVSLRGEGFATQLFFENRAGIPTGITVNQSGDIDISDLRVTGSDVPTLSRGIYISFSNGVRVRNVWQSGANSSPTAGPLAGIGTTESSEVWVTDCDVSGNGFAIGPDVFNSSYDIVQFSGPAKSVHFRNNKVHDSSTAISMVLFDVDDADMIGNTVDQGNKLGTKHGASGYGLVAYGGFRQILRIQINNNRVRNTAGNAIYVAAVDHLEASMNEVERTVQRQETPSLPLAGIALNGVNDGTVSGGWVRESRLAGIEIASGKSITLKGVNIASAGSDGIKIGFSSDITVQDIKIERPGGQGIYSPAGARESRIQITNTVIDTPARQGIYMDLVEDSTIANVTIVSPGEKGILITNKETSRLKVNNNEIKGIRANEAGITIYGAHHVIGDNSVAAASNSNSIGIDTNNSTADSVISGNRITGFEIGILDTGGLRNQLSRNILSGNKTPLKFSPTSRAVDNR